MPSRVRRGATADSSRFFNFCIIPDMCYTTSIRPTTCSRDQLSWVAWSGFTSSSWYWYNSAWGGRCVFIVGERIGNSRWTVVGASGCCALFGDQRVYDVWEFLHCYADRRISKVCDRVLTTRVPMLRSRPKNGGCWRHIGKKAIVDCWSRWNK